jgi:hypothetical protein
LPNGAPLARESSRSARSAEFVGLQTHPASFVRDDDGARRPLHVGAFDRARDGGVTGRAGGGGAAPAAGTRRPRARAMGSRPVANSRSVAIRGRRIARAARWFAEPRSRDGRGTSLATARRVIVRRRPLRLPTSAATVLLLLVACSGSDAGSGSGADSDAGVEDAPRAGDANDAASSDAAAPGAPARDGSTDAPPSPRDAGGCGTTSSPVFTCTPDGGARVRCDGGTLVHEECSRGCLRAPPGSPATCMGTTDAWSCTGSYGTTKAADGDYYVTAFGCWRDAQGVEHGDAQDNCIPSCLAAAQKKGICAASDTGKACEEKVNWYTADGARFGCLARLRVTNPANGKAVVALALDYGPGCSGEARVTKSVLDSSSPVDRYLFGADHGASDRALVHVVEVDDSTPLGPVP